MDRLQNASLYVTQSSRRFDNRGGTFITFFKPHLDNRIKNVEQGNSPLLHQGDIIRVQRLNPDYYRVKNLIRGLSARHGYPMDLEDALEFDIELDDAAIRAYQEIHVEHVPLQSVEEVEDIIDDDPAVNPEARQVSLAAVKAVFELLNERQNRVVVATVSRQRTTSQIATAEGISKQAVYYAARTSYDKLRKIPQVRQLLYSE
jgi:DNA-directed RNA polymerase specialized sigma subunit